MIYARAADVNVYIKRNFAPLEDRVRSLVAIESQIPNILIAAQNKPRRRASRNRIVELGDSDRHRFCRFLEKRSRYAAVSGLKDEQLRVAFQAPIAKPQPR